jgi:hypothetical protein
MSLAIMVVTLMAVGTLLGLVNTCILMDRRVKTILNVAVLVMILWLLTAFGVIGRSPALRIPAM